MAKIEFNIKYRPQIESGEYKVVTKDNKNVRIISWDMHTSSGDKIVALVTGQGGQFEKNRTYLLDGRCCSSQHDSTSLFILTNNVELTEFEIELVKIMKEEGSPIGADTSEYTEEDIAAMHSYSERLLALARKQLQPEIDAEIDKAYKNSDAVQYRRGKEDALKDMPHWKHMYAGAAGSGDGRNIYLIRDGIDSYRLSPVIAGGDDYLVLAELDKLPKL